MLLHMFEQTRWWKKGMNIRREVVYFWTEMLLNIQQSRNTDNSYCLRLETDHLILHSLSCQNSPLKSVTDLLSKEWRTQTCFFTMHCRALCNNTFSSIFSLSVIIILDSNFLGNLFYNQVDRKICQFLFSLLDWFPCAFRLLILVLHNSKSI